MLFVVNRKRGRGGWVPWLGRMLGDGSGFELHPALIPWTQQGLSGTRSERSRRGHWGKHVDLHTFWHSQRSGNTESLFSLFHPQPSWGWGGGGWGPGVAVVAHPPPGEGRGWSRTFHSIRYCHGSSRTKKEWQAYRHRYVHSQTHTHTEASTCSKESIAAR